MGEEKVVHLSDENFDQEVLKSELPVLVDFWASWCGPCQMMGPVISKLAEEYEGKIKICKLNIDEGRETAIKYSVMSIPTINIFKSGEVVNQITGAVSEAELKNKIDSSI